jgi:hypothetical protein
MGKSSKFRPVGLRSTLVGMDETDETTVLRDEGLEITDETMVLPGEGEILKSNILSTEDIRLGMDVVSVDGELIGRVKGVRKGDFLINRPVARDLWVPFACVVEVVEEGGTSRAGPPEPSEVVLNVSAAHVDLQGWQDA